MSFSVAIPSYKRPALLRDRTLKLLQQQGVDPASITVFVADSEEARVYRHTLDRGTYAAVVVGRPGIEHQRNFILDHYADGERIVSVDDDLENISTLVDSKTLSKTIDFRGIAASAFKECSKAGARLWGVYPVANPYFMKMRITRDLKFVIGCLHGYINDRSKDSPLRVSISGKEDVERTCKCYLADGSVVRFDYVTMHQRYAKEPGGLQGIRTKETELWAANRLVELFPELCSLNLGKANGIANVRLRDARKRG